MFTTSAALAAATALAKTFLIGKGVVLNPLPAAKTFSAGGKLISPGSGAYCIDSGNYEGCEEEDDEGA